MMNAARAELIAIRDSRPDDRPMIIAFMGELQAHEASMADNLEDPRQMAEPHIAALEEWAARAGGGFLVAEMAGAIIGLAIFGLVEQFGYYVRPQFRRCGCISDLYVESSQRERGVGRRLIEAAEDRLRAAGVKRIEITTLSENVEARGFYEAAGYAPYQVQYARTL